MYGLSKKIIVGGLVFCFVQSTIDAVPLQLMAPSYEKCVEDSRDLRTTFERQHYIRAAILTVSTVATLSFLYDYFFGTEAPAVVAPKSEKTQSLFSLKTLENGAKWLARASAQGICVQWITRMVFANNADPKVYISKHIHHYYKTHSAEIERLLQIRAAEEYLCNECNDIDILIQCHLQALIDKIEQLMAYMRYYASAHVPTHTEALVERYAQEVLKKIAILVEQSNTASADNFDAAVLTCKQQCADILTSAIRYALASLPSDD